MEQEKSISSIIHEEINNPTFDLAQDYTELALDEFTENESLKEIPIVKTVVGIVKTGLIIKEKFFVKKILTFLKEFHTKEIEEECLNDFKEKFNSDIKYRNQVIDQIILLNDRFLDVLKSKILANLFSSYIEHKYDWNYFKSLSYCLDNIHPEAMRYLFELEKIEFKTKEGEMRDNEREAILFSSGIAYFTSDWSSSLNISKIGKDLFEYGIKKNAS